MDSVAGYEPVRIVRGILESRTVGREHDIAEQGELGVDIYRSVNGGNDRDFDVEQVLIRCLASQ